MKLQNDIGVLVRDAREKHNLSTRELAALCSISNTELNRIERGSRKRPALLILKSFENHLGLNFRTLARMAGYSEKTISDGIRMYELNKFKNRLRKEIGKRERIDYGEEFESDN